MFEFKKPIVKKNEELINVLNKYKEKYKQGKEIFYEESGDLFGISGHYRNGEYINLNPTEKVEEFRKKYAKNYNEVYQDCLDLVNDLHGLNYEVSANGYFHSVWYAKIYCPYTGEHLRTEHFSFIPTQPQELLTEKSVPLEFLKSQHYRDEGKIKNGTIIKEKVYLKTLASIKMPKLSSNELKDYYSPTVIKIFKKEWGFDLITPQETVDFVRFDDMKYATIFNGNTNGFIKKLQKFNFKLGRYVKGYRTIILESPDIENFEEKLLMVSSGGDYNSPNNKHDLEEDYKIVMIKELLDSKITDDEKIEKIKLIVNDLG